MALGPLTALRPPASIDAGVARRAFSPYLPGMAQDAALLTSDLVLHPPARGQEAWQLLADGTAVGTLRPPERGPGRIELHGLGFDLSYGRLDDGTAALARPWQMTLEGAGLFHAWTVPRATLAARLFARNRPLYALHDHGPALQMILQGGLKRQIALQSGPDLLALADYPRGRTPRRIRHAPTLPPAILAAICHAVTQPA